MQQRTYSAVRKKLIIINKSAYKNISNYSNSLKDIKYSLNCFNVTEYFFRIDSSGTLLYDENQKLVKEIEWKQARGLAFSCDPKGKKSWHSYTNTTDQFRTTLNINIRTGEFSNWGIVKKEYLHTIG